MVFKRFCIDSRIYEESNGKIVEVNENGSQLTNQQIKEQVFERFLDLLTLCHTVQVDEESTNKYNASSPDELGFIKFCKKYAN